MNTPDHLKFTKDHEWVAIDGDIATVGITDFAQGELGDIVFIEIETLDDDLNQEDVFGSIEAVKTVSDLFMPISGTVIEVNEEIDSNPETVNADPYGEGWLIKVKIKDPAELASLLDAEGYKALIGA
jgi:glycine cleavage system H protein